MSRPLSGVANGSPGTAPMGTFSTRNKRRWMRLPGGRLVRMAMRSLLPSVGAGTARASFRLLPWGLAVATARLLASRTPHAAAVLGPRL